MKILPGAHLKHASSAGYLVFSDMAVKLDRSFIANVLNVGTF